jgi:hypothetical protein
MLLDGVLDLQFSLLTTIVGECRPPAPIYPPAHRRIDGVATVLTSAGDIP